ncbi:hypothetical protein HYDPIDRAFT_176802 [Hydnomerulius pinastri MD-312]|uniref:NTF2 domain-containing protein n=1 Tax=Hydnomerulius pinastri MD-312 TaxID=994086 RepID=A0A0C9W593_9AGAM|nr:hypothetical protein HYDPIDRAFT_176802 [Hydnomerulius pinastri MD-312]
MSSASAIHQNVVPSEVGWQFVPQYYTFVNKHPNRLHCFYTKTSTFIHGTEGEDVKPCFGQQEIHNMITSIGFEDCKVFIHSVDAQSSANGGIIIQVIGEMSNHGDPWRKFVQTFFLAEQTNGYFVLNDIFRFLKEETVEDDVSEADASVSAAPSELAAPSESAPEPVVDPAPAPPREPTPPPPASVSEEELTTVQPEPATPPAAPEPKLVESNGIHHDEPEPSPEPTPATPSEPSPAPSATPSLPESASPAPSPAPQLQAPPPAASPAPPPPAPAQQQLAPAPAKPAAPKTWASLAAADSKRWGSQVATESKGLTEVPAASSSPAPTSGTQSPASHGPPAHRSGPHHGSRELPAVAAAQALTTPQCFVKGVIEPLSPQQLSQVLTQRFGAVKDMEIVRSKACAFLEFLSLDAAKKAIITSLPQNQGGEGGIRIDVGGEVGQVRIVVETRKERADRPQSRPRGGGPMNGDARGGFRGGRGGPGGRGRGGPPAGK